MDNLSAPSLEAKETSGRLSMPESYRVHSVAGCAEEMQATRETYALMDDRSSERRLNALDTCRCRAWFVRHELTGDLRIASKSCKLRWCPLCSRKRQWFLVEQFKPWAASVDKLKFLTLTLKHSNSPLQQQIDDLYKSFQAFRKLKYLRDNMFGGVWFFQIKKSKASGQWHPHLHCLVSAQYMSQDKLSQLWCRTTLGSTIIDIRSAGNSDEIANYVSRYAARPSSLSELGPADRLELVQALHGKRLVGVWGTAKDMTLAMQKPPDASSWKYIGAWTTVKGTLNYDTNANKIFNAWRKGEALDPGITMDHIENMISDYDPYIPKEPPENKQLYFNFKA